MGYPLRNQTPNTTHHVYSRCSELRDMMKETMIKNLMLDVITMTKKIYKFELNAFVIMDNHFHFVIRVVEGGATISQVMQFIKSQFARRYNKMMNRTGPFWNERFKDKIIEFAKKPLDYFLNLVNYLGYNPVRKKITKNPRDYQHSSFNYFFDENYKAPVAITEHPFFNSLGKTFIDRSQIMLGFEQDYINNYANDWHEIYSICSK